MQRIANRTDLYKISRNKNNLGIYNLNMSSNKSKCCRKYSFGTPSLSGTHKTVMLVGATGSGKTTLINGMINYILDVKREDPVRFELIPKESNKSEAYSQTSEIAAYQINHCNDFAVDFTLTIIDTPGFGDTGGIQKDIEIVEKMRQLFSEKDGIDSIDAVGFVVQSALPRLTATQRYIFDSIISIFGKDIEHNIVLLTTYADGKTPEVLQAIQEANVPCAKKGDGTPLHFKFNNSALFAANGGAEVGAEDEGEGHFDELFWKMGMGSLKRFFTHLGTMETRSLQQTKEVLEERKILETTVEGLLPTIQMGLGKLDEMTKTEKAIQTHWYSAEQSKDFEYEINTFAVDKVKLASGIHTTTCRNCNYTCHKNCRFKLDSQKKRCSAMTNGSCRNCPGKCTWNSHSNLPYIFVCRTIKQKKTYHNLKEKYESSHGKALTASQLLQHLKKEYTAVQLTVLVNIQKLSKSQERLGEIALRPNPLAAPDYIDLMIESEKMERKDGFMERIEELHRVQKRAVILKKVSDKETLLPN